MNILIDIGHPAHIHLFKNLSWNLASKGHQVFFAVRDIPVAKRLLDYYGFEYYDLGKKQDGLIGKAYTILTQDLKLFKFVKSKKIDFGLSSGIVLPHVSRVTSMKSFVFDDDDDSVEKFVTRFAHPFADVVFSPEGIERRTIHKLMYPSTHEWAYLHPNYFKPDPKVLGKAGIQSGERFFVMRFVAFKGHHDVGESGISVEQKRRLIKMLTRYGRVIITSERKIEPEFEQYRLPVAPEYIHSLMYYSSLFLGDSQTMTSEAALMGIPALKCNTFAGRLAVPNMLEKDFGLCYAYLPSQFAQFYEHAERLAKDSSAKSEWKEKLRKFQDTHIDSTRFFAWFIENYPDSCHILKRNPQFIDSFK